MHWKSLGLAECLGSLEVNPTCTSTCLCQFVFGCKEAERDRWEIRLGFGHFARGTAGLRVGLGRPWTRRGADASKHLETTSTPSALVLGPVEVGTVGVDQVGKEILAPPHSGPCGWHWATLLDGLSPSHVPLKPMLHPPQAPIILRPGTTTVRQARNGFGIRDKLPIAESEIPHLIPKTFAFIGIAFIGIPAPPLSDDAELFYAEIPVKFGVTARNILLDEALVALFR